ncbi:hypothetical protein MASR1M45_07930 [Candidatus Kapaibacterium sp.]
MIKDFKFDKQVFFDLPPEEKSVDELAILVLRMARGDEVKNKIYSRHEIELMARKMVLAGFLRGTALDNDKCVWSRLTRRGELWLELAIQDYKQKSDKSNKLE